MTEHLAAEFGAMPLAAIAACLPPANPADKTPTDERAPKLLDPDLHTSRGGIVLQAPPYRFHCFHYRSGVSFWGIVLQAPPIVLVFFDVNVHVTCFRKLQGFGARSDVNWRSFLTPVLCLVLWRLAENLPPSNISSQLRT
jgi:hypothetical protein